MSFRAAGLAQRLAAQPILRSEEVIRADLAQQLRAIFARWNQVCAADVSAVSRNSSLSALRRLSSPSDAAPST